MFTGTQTIATSQKCKRLNFPVIQYYPKLEALQKGVVESSFVIPFFSIKKGSMSNPRTEKEGGGGRNKSRPLKHHNTKMNKN